MTEIKMARPSRALLFLTKASLAVGCTALLAACASDLRPSSEKTASVTPGTLQTKTKFTSKDYGVAASERIVTSAYEPIPRGGGRAQVGKPYKIRGRWYKPRHNPRYDKVGIASWYGPNFHGRKTANGEIYDQTALSAAHPTLPLPSYVKVTNVTNKRSVIVRVNDRGPFVGNRLIDLSYRTAELLGTRAGGLAKVRVQYVGPARLDAQDEDYLLASYEGPGSVHTSELAARNKLLAYAGLPLDTELALRGRAGNGETQKAQSAKGAGGIVNAVFTPERGGVGFPSVRQQTKSGFVPTNAALLPSPPPKPRSVALGQTAYANVEVSERVKQTHAIFDDLVKETPLRTIHVADFNKKDRAFGVMDELSYLGDVSIDRVGTGSNAQFRVTLQSRAVVALKRAQMLAPDARISDN
ncbi:MAG: septal ring lytic transglycosylase RlpA family protein [Pseudomonadota bacterium]